MSKSGKILTDNDFVLEDFSNPDGVFADGFVRTLTKVMSRRLLGWQPIGSRLTYRLDSFD